MLGRSTKYYFLTLTGVGSGGGLPLLLGPLRLPLPSRQAHINIFQKCKIKKLKILEWAWEMSIFSIFKIKEEISVCVDITNFWVAVEGSSHYLLNNINNSILLKWTYMQYPICTLVLQIFQVKEASLCFVTFKYWCLMPGILGLSSSVPLLLTVFPLQMAKSSVLWNPLIYLCMNTSVIVKSLKSFARLFMIWLIFCTLLHWLEIDLDTLKIFLLIYLKQIEISQQSLILIECQGGKGKPFLVRTF